MDVTTTENRCDHCGMAGVALITHATDCPHHPAAELRALRESISIETFIGRGAGAPRRSEATLTLRIRGVVDPWSAAHLLAAAVAPIVGPAGAARAYVDTGTGDVLVECSTIANAQVARMHASRIDLVGKLSSAMIAIGLRS